MNISFFLMTNAECDITNSTVRCVENARWNLMAKGIHFVWDIAAGYGQNKSKCVSLSKFFLHTDMPYLISIDRDMVFGPESVEMLYKDLQDGYDLISGIYCMRSGKRLSGNIGDKGSFFILDGDKHAFQYIPWGFTGVSRRLLQKMVDELELPLLGQEGSQFYPFCEEKVSSEVNDILGDDTSFCEKAHQSGITAYVDTAIQVGHFGDKIYKVQDFVDYTTLLEKANESG